MTRTVCLLGVALCLVLLDRALPADSGAEAADVQKVLSKGVQFLKSAQNTDGSFAPKIAGPGVSALVAAALLRNGMTREEPLVAKTLGYLEKQVQKDGGIYNKFLANYATSVAVMAFQEANHDGKYNGVLKNAAAFLKGLQQGDQPSDVKYGGFGYDRKSRPDLSNSSFAVEALLAAGVPKDDPAIKKALQFISRCQNLPGEFNDQPFATKAAAVDKGGFVYRPDPDDKEHATPEGGLRSQGAMTYGGLKSFLFAGVSKDDPRVKAAIAWIGTHYTLDENPGMGKAGLFYYYHTFGKALSALGQDMIEVNGTRHDWRRDLFEALRSRQQQDGSWRNQADRTFGEVSPELASAFALLSLHYCVKK